jgi:hypothetical protein
LLKCTPFDATLTCTLPLFPVPGCVIVVVTPDGSAFITTSDTLPLYPAGRVTVALVVPLPPGCIESCVGLRPNPRTVGGTRLMYIVSSPADAPLPCA